MQKDKHKGKTIRSNNHEILKGRKPGKHTPRSEKRKACKLRRVLSEVE